MNTGRPAEIAPSLEEYAACNRKLTDLQAEAIATWDRMARVASMLSVADRQSAEDIGKLMTAIHQETRDFPTVDDIRNLAEEIRKEVERKQRLYRALKSIGVEPEDSAGA